MKRNLRNACGFAVLALLLWHCQTDPAAGQHAAGDYADKPAGKHVDEAVDSPVPDKLLLPFEPSWNMRNPPLLYYGREFRFLDLEYGQTPAFYGPDHPGFRTEPKLETGFRE